MIPNMIEACVEITRNHFIGINTNLTSGKIKEFSEKINPERVLYIQASLHIKELERLNLLEKYIHNFQLCRVKGFDITAHVVAYPPLLDEVEKYKEYFQEKGISVRLDPFIGEYNGKKYPDFYSEKEIKILSQSDKNSTTYKQKGKLCNAGYNVGVVNPYGYISPCFNISRSIGKIHDKVRFNKKLIRCPFKFCKCPLNFLDPYLYEKGKKEAGTDTMAPVFLIKDLSRDYIKEVVMKHLPDAIRKKIFNFAVRHGL